jgi:dihydrofolate reductase
MRRLRYNVACSLDGFIAGPNGEYDWIVEDDSIDMVSLFNEFDLLLMGRKTYETVQAAGEPDPTRAKRTAVVSTTLEPSDRPDLIVLRDRVVEQVAAWKQESGKDIWLFGGSQLAGMLIDARLIDTIELAVMPVLLRQGIPLLPAGKQTRLSLDTAESLASGIQMLCHRVNHDL